MRAPAFATTGPSVMRFQESVFSSQRIFLPVATSETCSGPSKGIFRKVCLNFQ